MSDWGEAVNDIADSVIAMYGFGPEENVAYLDVVQSLMFILSEYGFTEREERLYGELRVIEAELEEA